MNLIHALCSAGSTIFRLSPDRPAPTQVEQDRQVERDIVAGSTITKYIRSQGLDGDGLEVKYNPATRALFIYGTVTDVKMRDRILTCCHHVARVSRVVDRMLVRDAPETPHWAQFAQH